MLNNTKFTPIVTELSIRDRKQNISLAFIAQSYFAVQKNVTLNSKPYFIMKIPNKRPLQQIAFNHLSELDFKGFMSLYKQCTVKPYSSLVLLLLLHQIILCVSERIFRKEYEN